MFIYIIIKYGVLFRGDFKNFIYIEKNFFGEYVDGMICESNVEVGYICSICIYNFKYFIEVYRSFNLCN